MNARVLSIERSIAELEGKVLDMETASLRAKQDISRATQDATNLQNDRDAGLAQERQQAEADIEGLNLKIAMYKDLMAEAMARDPQAALSTGAAATVSFSIVRKTGEEPTETPADENTPVLPGDVIKVGIAPVAKIRFENLIAALAAAHTVSTETGHENRQGKPCQSGSQFLVRLRRDYDFGLRARLFGPVRTGIGACILCAVAAACSGGLSPLVGKLRQILLDHGLRRLSPACRCSGQRLPASRHAQACNICPISSAHWLQSGP